MAINMSWTKEEVQLIVADYFNMLHLELAHKDYKKSIHRNALASLLNNRSNASIEFKHQNISAILVKMGLPFIKGYKPRFNYQRLLETIVADFLSNRQGIIEKEFVRFANEIIPPIPAKSIIFEDFLSDEPDTSEVKEWEPRYQPIKINYLEKEQNNRQLGESGEQLVIDYEKWRLIRSGKNNLADKVEWVAKEKGDGMGFDILSKNNNGTDRFIEVKTTKLSKETPIYLSRNELSFASLKAKDFYLYRVFNFSEDPQLFIKQGNYESFCTLQAQNYKGFF